MPEVKTVKVIKQFVSDVKCIDCSPMISISTSGASVGNWYC